MTTFVDKDKNYDDVFIRNVIVGIQSFLFDKITYKQIVNGVNETHNLRFYYSYTGSEDFLIDHFLPFDVNCEKFKLDGNVITIPSGIFTINSISIKLDALRNNHERVLHKKKIVNEFGSEIREFSTRTGFIPISFNLTCAIKTSSDIMRFKIWQSIVRILYKTSKFYISFEGFDRIPCFISTPEDADMEKEYQFSGLESNKRQEIKLQIEVQSYLPDIDTSTEFYREEKMDKGIEVNINTNNSLEQDIITDK